MGVKDGVFLAFAGRPDRFADLVNGTLFHGNQIVNKAFLQKCSRKKRIFLEKTVSSERKEITFLRENTSEKKTDEETLFSLSQLERERDIFMLYCKDDSRFYLSCEGQTEADYTMPVRNLTYDGVEYTNQLEERRKEEKEKYKREKCTEEKDDRKVSGKEKTGRSLLPVFHMVFYLGHTRWLSKHQLREMMEIPELVKDYEGLLPDYRINLIDIHDQDPELFHTEWKEIFRVMKHSRKKEELKAYIGVHKEEIRNLSLDARRLLSVLLDQYEILSDGSVEVKEVCEAWDGAMQMYAEEAAERTRKMAEKKEQDLLNLFSILASENRIEDIRRAAQDRSYLSKLLGAVSV